MSPTGGLGGRRIAGISLSLDIAPSFSRGFLGISIEAATRWSRLLNRDWADYQVASAK